MQAGEVLRRTAFNAIDFLKGGKMNRLIKVNTAEIVNGITPEYEERRLEAILDYAKEHCAFYKGYADAKSLADFPVMKKMDYNEHREEIFSDEYSDDRVC